MGTPIVAVNQQVVALQPGEAALEEPLAVHLLPHHDLGATPGKPPVILDAPERPIQSRRRDLQGVRARYDVLDVENRAQIATDMGAIVDADALAGVGGRPRPVDEHSEHHALALTTGLHVENPQAVARCHAGRRLPDLLENVRAAHFSRTLTYSVRPSSDVRSAQLQPDHGPETKKVGTCPLGSSPRLRNQNYSTAFDGFRPAFDVAQARGRTRRS